MDKGMLTEATSTDDSPTPGYMLNEITHATMGSYAACTQLIEFLNARLKKNNHNVKYKCCLIIKHVCRSGRADFKKDMARNLDNLKECLQYKGVPDPLRGDEIYRRVRDAAKEALDAIFDSQQPVTSTNPTVASRIQGFSGGQEDEPTRRGSATSSSSTFSSFTSSAKSLFGMDSSSGYTGNHGVDGGDFSANNQGGFGKNQQDGKSTGVGGSYNGGSSSMTGIGNPNFQDARKEDQSSITRRMSAAASGMLNKITSATLANSTSSNSNFNSNNNSSNNGNRDDYQFRSNRQHNFGNNQNSTGAWGPSGNSGSNNSNDSPQQMVNPNPIVPDIPTSTGGTGRAGSASTSGEYERGLVEALCTPGGMKAVPQEDKLASFLRTAPTLSAELVGNALLEFMNDDAWQSRVKALIVLCRLMNTSNCEEHAVWWADNGEQELLSLRSDGKACVRTQANKALRLIGLEGEVAAVMDEAASKRRTGGRKKQPSTDSGSGSLLDFEDTQVTPSPQQQMPGKDVSNDGDIFSGLSLGSGDRGKLDGNSQSFQHQSPAVTTSVFDSVDSGVQNVLSFSDSQVNHPAKKNEPPSSSAAISSLDFLTSETSDNAQNEDDIPTRERQSSVSSVTGFDFMGGGEGSGRSRNSSVDRGSLTGFDFMGGVGGGNMPTGSNMNAQQQQQLIQQQQQIMQMQQQQFYLQQQQMMQHQMQQQNLQHGNRQYQPATSQLGGNVMGGLGMGRKHIPDPANQHMNTETGFGFTMNQSPPSSRGKKMQGNDAFSFVSDTVASKKASTNFSNKIT